MPQRPIQPGPRMEASDDDAPGMAPGIPGVAIRRHHDRCFHVVEEVVPEGYIVQGVLIAHDEVAQVHTLADGQPVPACRRP